MLDFFSTICDIIKRKDMLTAEVNRSLRRIVSSKKKVLEIQHVIASKRIKDRMINRSRDSSKALLDSQTIQNFEPAMQKLNFIASCIPNKGSTIINLLKNDRFKQLSMREIYDELSIDFQREIALHTPSQYMEQTG